MNADRRRRMWLVLAGAAAALLMGIVTTALLAATGAFRSPHPANWRASSTARCTAPPLPGQVVEVTLADMGPGMMDRPSGPGPGWSGMRMMRLIAHPTTVTAGTVSLRAVNAGYLTHEVVVLPLPAERGPGQLPTGADGRIDEAGSLGEASRSCGAGAGNGIAPGATGWITLTLRPGHYELVCNIPGHYLAGMYAELDVTGR
ncbi:sulfocyanin-like copper-binding protein [Streptomyces sp. NPDC006510]|uniref:sulfocyanin-like copper-binding protein n=1 Tax=Streptomyces sp. NPDC006510 TaxID=3155600 RepID=UPI0033B9CC7E